MASLSKSLEVSSNEQHLSTSLGKLRKRHKTLKTEELTFKDTDLIQETEENFRKSVVLISSERFKQIGNVKNHHSQVMELKENT